MSCVEGGSGTDEGAQEPLAGRELSSDKLFAGFPEFLIMPLLMRPVCLLSQGQYEEPVRPLVDDVVRYCIPSEKDELFSHAQRSAIVDYILRRKSYTDDTDEKYSYGMCAVSANNLLGKRFISHMYCRTIVQHCRTS